jgi:2-amino-4-hydroxy-6-hydroxymethyldihydropteridine diphosphokinase
VSDLDPAAGPATTPAHRWIPAYVGVGSNLGDPRARVTEALAALRQLPASRLVACSPLYRTEPFGPVEQPEFINAVAGLLTTLEVGAFFASLRAVESALGRVRDGTRWGPRRIDLDLLVFGSQCREGGDLQLPHPGIAERAFVLYPLRDLAPQLVVPGLGRVEQLAARLPATGVARLD